MIYSLINVNKRVHTLPPYKKKKKKKKVYTHLHAKQLGKGSLDLVDWRLQLLPKEFDFSEKIKSYLYIGS